MPRISWRGLRHELTAAGARDEDLECFEEVVSRRRFLGISAASSLAWLGAEALPRLFSRGLVPRAWASEAVAVSKRGMTVFSDGPLNGEFPPHLLADSITPTERHFVRNHGRLPAFARDLNATDWTLTIEGETYRSLTLSLADLQAMPAVTTPVVIEGAGNGRAHFEPAVPGYPWTVGAVACSEWTGVRLSDLLQRAGLSDSAAFTAHFSADSRQVSADSRQGEAGFSRGLPLDKAMAPGTIMAYQMNGQPLPALHGFPARLIVPGWIGSCSQKWLTRIEVRNQVHESLDMSTYRVPRNPLQPGELPADSAMQGASRLPVKSIITAPAAGTTLTVGSIAQATGHAWVGERRVEAVEVSTDYGARWRSALVDSREHWRHAWVDWRTELRFEQPGYYEIWARAKDDQGEAQPFRQPWNPGGYLGNAVHRLPVTVKPAKRR